MKHKVTIEEHVSRTFEIEAASEEEAMELAINGYRKGELVVEDANITAKLIQVGDSEWSEF